MGAKSSDHDAPVIHVLLLAFHGSILTEDVERLEEVLQESYECDVCTYWIGGSTAHSRLDNVLLGLLSKVQHHTEKVILYYGGYSMAYRDDSKNWKAECGAMLHGYDCDEDEDRDGTQCGQCVSHIDPSGLFTRVLSMPNDVLFIFHAYFDAARFERWARNDGSPFPSFLYQPNDRKRNVQMLVLEEPSSSLRPLGKWECQSEYSCSPKHCVKVNSMTQPWATDAMTDALLRLAKRKRFSVDDLCEELEDEKYRTVVGTKSILGKKRDWMFKPPRRHRSKPPEKVTSPPSSLSEPGYDRVHCLLLSWQGVTNCSESSITIMEEALEYLNFDVHTKEIPEAPSWGGHDGWIGKTVHDFTRKYSKGNTLLIVYYVGHGEIDNTQLKGFRTAFRDKACIDISLLQNSLRHRCTSDVLLILDCCDAGFVQPARDQIRSRHVARHTMETLAACAAGSNTVQSAYSKKLAGELIMLSGRDESITVDELNTSMLEHVRFDENNQYGGNVRILNCGGPSIVLRRVKE